MKTEEKEEEKRAQVVENDGDLTEEEIRALQEKVAELQREGEEEYKNRLKAYRSQMASVLREVAESQDASQEGGTVFFRDDEKSVLCRTVMPVPFREGVWICQILNDPPKEGPWAGRGGTAIYVSNEVVESGKIDDLVAAALEFDIEQA